ncbi:glycosyltransferase [Myxococcota bacterium]|nr:glycosyltransferase [Myxococcota bacterium]
MVPNGARLDPAAAGRRIAALPGARAVVQAGLLRRPEDALPLAAVARGLPPSLQLRLAGDPEHEGAAALLGDLGDAGRPFFEGFLPPGRVASLYDGALCALALYAPTVNARDFASPLKVLEAHAAGVPLVATDLPAVRELADDGADALLVPPGDPRALVAAVARLHADRALAARLAAAGLARAASRTWDHRARDLRAVLAPAALVPEAPRAGASP